MGRPAGSRYSSIATATAKKKFLLPQRSEDGQKQLLGAPPGCGHKLSGKVTRAAEKSQAKKSAALLPTEKLFGGAPLQLA